MRLFPEVITCQDLECNERTDILSEYVIKEI
jgi:hypothetical protein